jgi:uncharacterized protein with NRDE domain
MCLCILAHQQLKTHPTIVAANREERYARPATMPAWSESIFAGRDTLAGGTWQGLNPSGLHVALTNRRGATNDPARRSRGQLCIDALRLHSARAAIDWLLDHLLHVRYNPCNLLVSDGTQAFVIHYDGSDARPITLAPGLHLLSETNINDPDHPRIQHARAALTPLPNNWTALKEKLQTLLADHNQDGAICLHGERGGTRSSALLALRERSLRSGQFHFADGPPCTAPYLDLSAELQNYKG